MTETVLPRIAVLALGGTIGAPVDATGGNSRLEITAADLVAGVPALAGIARVEPETFLSVMSADIGFDDIAALSRRIGALIADGIDGIVVTQGTDTLEESAYLLDLLTTAAVPIVVTGAMRNPGREGADGTANLLAAVTVAAQPSLAHLGVLVVLDQQIHLARLVQKTNTAGLGAFTSPSAGPLGWIIENRVRALLTAAPARDDSPTGVEAFPKVALLRLSLGDDPDLIDSLPALGYRGLVIETYGAGHMGGRTLEAVTRAVEVMPVVFASRTGSGELYRVTGGYPGSEGDLLRRGLISAVALDGLKARVLLTVLMASGVTDPVLIAARFESAI